MVARLSRRHRERCQRAGSDSTRGRISPATHSGRHTRVTPIVLPGT